MSVLWQRRLDHYPDTRARLWYLAVVVAATVVLYYELYVPGAVATEIIAQYHMTFPYYVYISVSATPSAPSPRCWPAWPTAGGGPTWSPTASA
jgi:hypothetical protein